MEQQLIHIERDPNPPDIPLYTSPDAEKKEPSRAQMELEAAIAFHTSDLNFKDNARLADKGFNFKNYKDKDLAAALYAIFGKKCAYCETDFGASTVEDIEHFRPKNEVELADKSSLKPGYYWLACEWTNLLFSCPECNRARNHYVPGQPKMVKLGKEAQFPLSAEAQRVRSHTISLAEEEKARLLLHPCEDHPEEHLTYNVDALILPREDANGVESKMGVTSIAVYALQRKELVERRKMILNFVIIDIENIRKDLVVLKNYQDLGASQAMLDAQIKEIAVKKETLRNRCKAGAEYLGMIRDYIRKTKAAGGFDDLLQNKIDPEMLL